MNETPEFLVSASRCFNCGDEKSSQALIVALLFEYAASRSGVPITADSTFITVDSTEITIDQTHTL